MRTSRKISSILAVWTAAVAACSLVPGPAAASTDMETVLQDDPKLVYEDDPVRLDRNLKQIASLGVDTVRVSLYWHLVAPRPTSRRRPRLGDGHGYLSGLNTWRWVRYDQIARLAEKNGVNVMFSLTGPAPRWATRGHGRKPGNVRPNAREFYKFVRAAGIRYSGSVADPEISKTWRSTSTPSPRIPRVTRWSIWNEPNFPSWLLPQWKRQGRRSYRAQSPGLYRRLADAAWKGLKASGHSGDIVLLGETAPYGPHDPRRPGTKGLMSAPQFIRELYCVDRRYRRYRGGAARGRGCPATAAARRRFRSRHPVLFHATGWAHHAYSLHRPPTFKGRRKDAAPLGATYRLTRALDRAQFRWGARTSDWPIWITEYGYQTLPPDPFRGVSWDRQAAWMSWAEYLAYRNRRIGSFAQFLLVDDAPRTGFAESDTRRWITWQSGFLTTDGREKPGMNEFRRPIHVTPARARRGRSARVFGMFRTAPYGVPIEARIEFSSSGGSWQTLDELVVTNPRGYVLRRVRPPGSGAIRIVWTDPRYGVEVPTRGQWVRR